VKPISRYLGERQQDERSLRHAGMGHPQIRLIDHVTSVEQEVEVELSRSEADTPLPPAGSAFDPLESSE